MKPDLAARLAATLFDDTSSEDVRTILRGFLSDLARCGACNGEGEITIDRDVILRAKPHGRGNDGETVTISAGETIPCPVCGGKDDERRPGSDPEFVAWHCVHGQPQDTCTYGTRQGEAEHSTCGYRLILPIDLFGSADQ